MASGGDRLDHRMTCRQLIEGRLIHHQRADAGLMETCGGQHTQPPGVEVPPIGQRPRCQPSRPHPTQIEPGAKYRDGIGQDRSGRLRSKNLLSQPATDKARSGRPSVQPGANAVATVQARMVSAVPRDSHC